MSIYKDTLIIPNVDLEVLERQRKHLNRLLFSDGVRMAMTAPEYDALLGIEAMLDEWSDNHEHS